MNQWRGVPRRLQIGRLVHRCVIQAPVETQQATGQMKVTGWRTVYDCEPCSFTSTGGVEAMRGRQLEANTTAIFIVNFRPDYSVQYRIVFNGITYGITHINMVEGFPRYREIVCKSCPL